MFIAWASLSRDPGETSSMTWSRVMSGDDLGRVGAVEAREDRWERRGFLERLAGGQRRDAQHARTRSVRPGQRIACGHRVDSPGEPMSDGCGPHAAVRLHRPRDLPTESSA